MIDDSQSRAASSANRANSTPAMAMQIRKPAHNNWQKLIQPAKLNARKRADCVLREARCAAKSGAVRTALEHAVAVEIDRMHALHESEEAIRAFRAATEVHIALCGPDASERPSSAISDDRSTAINGNDAAPDLDHQRDRWREGKIGA